MYFLRLFTFVKLLFLINSIVQMFLLNAFLGNEYHLFGAEVLVKFIRGLDWGESKRFPRVTLCDFHIREVGIVHRYTVQCVLPINLFNEKIFLVLWFWILLLVAFNLGDFIAWIIRSTRFESRSAYVHRKLDLKQASKADADDEFTSPEQARLDRERFSKKFIRKYLQEDGCFALRLLARNGQDIIVGEVIHELFEEYCREEKSRHVNSDRSQIYPNGSSFNNQHTTLRPTKTRTMAEGKQFDSEQERLT